MRAPSLGIPGWLPILWQRLWRGKHRQSQVKHGQTLQVASLALNAWAMFCFARSDLPCLALGASRHHKHLLMHMH